MQTKEKPTGVTTPPAGHCTTSLTRAIVQGQLPDDKAYAHTQAAFALRGHALTRSHRVDDGAVTYNLSRWGMSRNFTHWGDVLAFLAQVGG